MSTRDSSEFGYEDSLSMDTGGKAEDLRAFYMRERPGLRVTWRAALWFLAKIVFWSLLVAAAVILVLAL